MSSDSTNFDAPDVVHKRVNATDCNFNLQSSADHSVAISGEVTRIYLRNDDQSTNGSDIQIVCDISTFGDGTIVNVFKSDSTTIPNTSLVGCIKNTCFSSDNGKRYRYSADSSHVYIDITNLSRSEDGKWWTCALNTKRKNMFLYVYTFPAGPTLGGDTNGGDLQFNGVTLRCQTSNCIYPEPNALQWFYRKNSGQWVLYQTIIPTGTTSSCSDSEKIYSGTLTFPRNTTWPLTPLNVKTTVQFRCGILFPTLKSPVVSVASGNVEFAVKVTSVTIKLKETNKDLNSTETVMIIGDDSQTTFICIPSNSRPAATIVWYVGNSEKQRGISTQYVYTPIQVDNNRRIFCKAFNLQDESTAITSQQPILRITELQSVISLSIAGHQTFSVIVDEHDDVNLNCTVDTEPSSIIKISFQGKVLTESNDVQSLLFKRTSMECFHAGIYLCMASYQGHEASANTNLLVNCSPRPFHRPYNVTSDLYSPATLSFTAMAYPPPGSKGFQWYKEEGLRWTPLRTNAYISISSSGLESNLTILNVSASDYGQYRVTVTNSIDSYDQYMFLSSSNVGQSNTCSCTNVGNASSDNTQTALIVGVILGILLIVVTVYASYLTVLYRRVTRRTENTTAKGQKNKRLYVNQAFKAGHEEIEDRDYEQPIPIEQSSALTSSSTGQYTDLNRIAGEEKTTYDTLQI